MQLQRVRKIRKGSVCVKLICFPHAGGISLYYGFLRKYPYRNLEKILVFDYPRDSLIPSGTADDFRFYTTAAADYIRSNTAPDEEYLLFGHSMGAFVACEAGLLLQNCEHRPPAGVIVSGQNPPYAVTMGKHTEVPDDLYAFAKKLGGVPQKILDHPEICERFYRFAETDLKAVSQYAPVIPEASERLSRGLLIYGEDDCIVDQAYLSGWDKTFRSMEPAKVFAGDHFYFNQCPEAFSALIDSFAGSCRASDC